VEGLSQYFKLKKKTLKAVDEISFTVCKGEAFGLVGESGSGKTTTGRSIIGLYPISGGKVYFHGKLIASADKADRAEVVKNRKEARGIQMIFQDPVASLNPRMTVKEIVAEGLVVNGEKDEKVISEKVFEALKEVGLLPEHASRYPHEFSGGQRQRVGIARALIMKPELIIADEPVSALDVSIQAQVVNLLTDLKERLGLTVLFIAHDLSVVKYFCDRIAVMHFGKLVELAGANELFSHPLHPYTQSLLSAIPYPDPRYEKTRVRTAYLPTEYEEGQEASFREIKKGRFVYCSDVETKKYAEELKRRRGK
jgi:ABC-type oligopeptide transport system ATPase subunit